MFSINCQNSINRNIQLDRGKSLTGTMKIIDFQGAKNAVHFLACRVLCNTARVLAEGEFECSHSVRLPSLAFLFFPRLQNVENRKILLKYFRFSSTSKTLRFSLIPIAISFLLNGLLDYARILMATFDMSKIPKFILIHGIFEHARKSKQFTINVAISDIKMRRDAKHIQKILFLAAGNTA